LPYPGAMAEPDIAFATLDPDCGERFQPLRRELGVSTFGLNLIVLQPRERGRIHAHERQEEVYLVLEGELTLLVEGAAHVLGRNRLVRVGPTVRRQLVNAGVERLVLLALGGSAEHVGRDGRAWASWEDSGSGAPPQKIPLPENLPGGGLKLPGA
jgi:mannose-6-phosphate isomerase-like protein (cupin superfamily)